MRASESETRVCVVTGVGPGNGASISRKFSSEGYRVAMLARSRERLEELEGQIPRSLGIPTDVRDPAALRAAFARIRQELGPPAVVVHNAGSGLFKEFMDTTPEELEESWRTNALALLVCGQEAARDMLEAGRGAIVVIGATASLRGLPHTAPFASAKSAQRSLAQSMARSLGPKGIHVSYLVIDGVIDVPGARAFFPDKPDDFFLKPDSIAETVWNVVNQERSAWTFELDVRPFGEKW
ncbi:SDR family NAD(P)-dependent oxidoreductase [bacterium]|nr:SDR family NAD(P)-dependent oxidoreductase [bacterium]